MAKNPTTLTTFIKKPESLFIIAALPMVMISIFCWTESIVIDINGLTVFIDGLATLYLLSFSMLVWFLIYKVSSKYLFAPYLSWTHALLTVLMVAIFIDSGSVVFKWVASSEQEARMLQQVAINKQRPANLLSATGLCFLAAQLIYVMNLAIGLSRRKTSTSFNPVSK